MSSLPRLNQGVPRMLTLGRKHAATWLAELGQSRRELAGLSGVLAQLLLLALVIWEYQIEGPAFYRYIAPLAVAGFVVNHFLPRSLRLPFFAGVSLLGIGLVMGPEKSAWVVGLGLVLIVLCHMPVGFAWRVGLLLSAGALLMAARAGLLGSPVPAAVWPVLASMFMFRLIVYAYDLQHLKEPPPVSERLSYFFLLPNVVFPVFPVVDFKTFRSTRYDAEARAIYQRGVHWMFRGVLQLLIYRLVNFYLVISPDQVQTVGQLVQYIFATYLLYLRISGQFHLIVGLLHLFGFNLPETNHHYYLSRNFTDYWRRINIYWKDFMMKVFFYPAYFRLKHLGPQTALVLATLCVFLVTWSFHSYQWFWLRGSFLISANDMAFWGLLSVAVVANTLYEARHGRKRVLGKPVVNARTLLGDLAQIAAMFATISILWSFWSSASIGEWLALWRVPGGLGSGPEWLLAVLLFLAAGVAWTRLSESADLSPGSRLARALALGRAPLATGAALAVLYAAASPAVQARLTPEARELASNLRVPKLSGREAALLRRGYYEGLTDANTLTGQLWEVAMKRPDDWVPVHQSEAARETADFVANEHVPSTSIVFHGARYTTNRWGMRDRDYQRQKAPGTYRIALLGSSYAVGSGVGDGENFESLLEERMNRENPAPSIRRYELLNFSFGGYNALHQVRVLEEKALAFDPDAVFLVAHRVDADWSAGFLGRRNRQGGDIPYEPLREILTRAGVGPRTPVEEAQNRLLPFAEELVRWAYGRIAETCSRRGIVPVWIFLPYEPGVAEAPGPRATLGRLAREAGFQILDLSGVFDGHDPSTLQVAEWDSHPNRKGHQLIAEELYRVLRQPVAAGGIPLEMGDGR